MKVFPFHKSDVEHSTNTGKYLDSLTGEQYNLNRWYDTATGRWLSVGPISFDGGDANLYRYVGNFATVMVDPLGLAKR